MSRLKDLIHKWIKRYRQDRLQRLSLLPFQPNGFVNSVPLVIDKKADYFIIFRHGGRRAISIFESDVHTHFPLLRRDNEWRIDHESPHNIIPLIGTYHPHPTPGLGQRNVIANEHMPSDERPLSVGGAEQLRELFAYYKLNHFLPTRGYKLLHCNLTKRTVCTASLVWQHLLDHEDAPSVHFSVSNLYTKPPAPFPIVTTSEIQTGDRLFGGDATSSYGMEPPLLHSKSFGGVNIALFSKFRPEIYDHGHSLNYVSGPIPIYTSEVLQLVNRFFEWTPSQLPQLPHLIDWILQQYIDTGPWINQANLSPREYALLSNFYFSNLFSSGTSLFATPLSKYLVQELALWATSASPGQSAKHILLVGHDATLQALHTSLGLVSRFHNAHENFYPGMCTVFKRDIASGVITAYSLCPSANSHSVAPIDVAVHCRLDGSIELNQAIFNASS
ncbi:MAG: hypothetical protein Sylvanvirus1_80 [Sylvanvirus sp.]|uniref:Histidine phosphatase family protein n=1 Tax=Sylvanvirus sp. TaxID=2487774 RepID=A0A3G5AIQ9_9VIRU|nr:MAG: hypothetical protein Sylvanvirus1_80 [Sylvanvirus sp.]